MLLVMFKRETYYAEKSALLEDLLEVAGEEDHQPPEPSTGIPRQWVPRLISLPLKWLVYPYILLDCAMQRLARLIIRPPFKQEGKCKKRGNCCYYILIRKSNSPFGRLFYFWQTQINGFYLRKKGTHAYEGRQVYVMGCRYLKKDGTCSEYRLRPQICRQWPVIEHFGYPKILKGCGYRSNPPYPPEGPEDAFSGEGEGDPRLNLL